MTLKTVILVFAGLLCLSNPIKSADINAKAGTSSFSFLKINIGARSVGMGSAATGLANDEGSLYYNPAGIGSFEEKRLIAGYHNYFADLQSGYLGVIKPISEKIVAGVSLDYLSYGSFVRTDEAGTNLGDFGGGDLMFAVTGAYRQSYDLWFGSTVKLLYEKVDKYSSVAIATDLAVRYSRIRNRLVFGLMIQNLGTQLSSLGNEKDPLPLTLRAGVSGRPRGLPITIAGDLVLPVDNDFGVALGAEYHEFKPFYFRLGWNSLGSSYRTADSEDKWAGLSIGAGFDIKRYQISYAFTPAAELGESHRITITGGI